jgi:hypothetical protein
MPGEWERRQGIHRREFVEDVVEGRVNEGAQFVTAAGRVGEYQSPEDRKEFTDELWRVRAAAPLQARGIRFSAEVVRTDRDR